MPGVMPFLLPLSCDAVAMVVVALVVMETEAVFCSYMQNKGKVSEIIHTFSVI